MDNFCYKRKLSCATAQLTLLLLAKMSGTQRRACTGYFMKTYYGMPKGTSQAKAILNSEKIKL